MQLEFFGAAGEVTGSCHIIRVAGARLLLDCGMVQGGRDAPERNRLPFPFEASAIDAVVLSHAHVDHCGRLPLLVKRGFRGPIYTNPACADLVPILLRDSANLAIKDAERQNRDEVQGRSDENRVQPLFDLDDVERTLRLIRRIAYDTPVEVLPGASVRVHDAGHILGSSSVELSLEENAIRRRIVFSGDLGQYDTPILKDPHRFESADLVLMESTYGNRRHRSRDDTERELGAIVAQAARDGGNILVPAFAIGRSQELLYLLAKNYGEWRMDRWKIFLDSPMAIAASRVYWKHPDRYDEEAARLREGFRGMPALPNLVLAESADESRAINQIAAAPSSSPAAAWPLAGASCITSSTTSNAPNVTWSSSDSRRPARWAAASWTVRPRCSSTEDACAARLSCTHSVDSRHMATRRISCVGMTASGRGRRCTSYTAKCPPPRPWPTSCANSVRRPTSAGPVLWSTWRKCRRWRRTNA